VVQQLKASDSLTGRTGSGRLTCYVSDNPQRFRELGQRFLDHPVVDVTWISPEQFFAQDAKAHV
jgi:hypothetical protein